MLTNTKTLFASLLKELEADCVCDIGSRDGDQALLFRDLRPSAIVPAFEANPINYQAMKANPNLAAKGIQIFPYAIANSPGKLQFHITDVDYSDPESNKGTSSLLVKDDLKIKETVEVDCRRIDDFLLNHFPQSRRIGLWIDVEGAEFGVLQGIAKVKDRILAVHVETAEIPMREGQQVLSEITTLMADFGLVPCGSNIRKAEKWGDVVFVHRSAIAMLGSRFAICKLKGYLSYWFPADALAVFLKLHFPPAYRLLRRLYLKVGT